MKKEGYGLECLHRIKKHQTKNQDWHRTPFTEHEHPFSPNSPLNTTPVQRTKQVSEHRSPNAEHRTKQQLETHVRQPPGWGEKLDFFVSDSRPAGVKNSIFFFQQPPGWGEKLDFLFSDSRPAGVKNSILFFPTAARLG